MNSNRGSLPTEIYLCILQQVDKEDLCKHALICKAWLPLVQHLLFSRVHIKHYKQLLRFTQTIQAKSRLEVMVKSFTMDDFIRDSPKKDRERIKEQVTFILTFLISTHLPNLETLQDRTSITCSPVLHALVDSRLKHLRRLGTPSFHKGKDVLASYTSCAILMKDRLENLLISDKTGDYFHDGQLFFDRLYSRLGQFSRLQEITIIKVTDEWIQLLDDITKSCPALEKITLDIRANSIRLNNNEISIDTISNFVPSRNVKSFKADLLGTLDEKILTYVMHKFPQLDECMLINKEGVIRETNQQIVEQFLQYISKMKKFMVGDLALAQNAMSKTLGNLWNELSTHGKEFVFYRYSDRDLVTTEKFTAGKEGTEIIHKFDEGFDWKHVDFLKANGAYLKIVGYILDIDRRRQSEQTKSLLDAFMADTFAYCPSIRGLIFVGFHLTPLHILRGKEHCLDEMTFVSCKIYKGALESLSEVLLEVKHLTFANTFHLPSEESSRVITVEAIKMPSTKVDIISFGVFRGDSRYIKVSNTTDESHYYCVLHSGNTEALPSTEKEFLNVSRKKRVRVRCKTNPIIKGVLLLPNVELYGLW